MPSGRARNPHSLSRRSSLMPIRPVEREQIDATLSLPLSPKKGAKKANEADTNNSAIEQQSTVPKAKATRLSELRNIAQGDKQEPSKQYDHNKGRDSSGHWVPRDLQRHDHKPQSPMLASHRQAPSISPAAEHEPVALVRRRTDTGTSGRHARANAAARDPIVAADHPPRRR